MKRDRINGFNSVESFKASRGLIPFALLEAFMLMGLIVLALAGFQDLVGDSSFPGVVMNSLHVVTIFIALIISQFFFSSLLWPAIVIYGAALILDVTSLIWRAISMANVYRGYLPSYYLNTAALRLWLPEFMIGLLVMISVGQIIRLLSIDRHERAYLSGSEKQRYSALYRPKAVKTFSSIQVVAIVDAVYTVFYFLIVFYYFEGAVINNLVWLQSAHFVTWLVSLSASVTRDIKWIVPMAVLEVLAGIFDVIVTLIYFGYLVACMRGTAPQSCTNTQLEELAMIFLTLILVVIDSFQIWFSWLILDAYRKFDIKRAK